MDKILFVGSYPNPASLYNRVFFKNLVESIADKGFECHVIAPVSITNYRFRLKKIPKKTVEKTQKGNEIHVYHPRFVSYSAKRIGSIKTGVFSEHAFEKAAFKCAKELIKNNSFIFTYGHFFLTGGLAAVKIGREYGIPSFIAFGECDFESQVRKPYGDLTEAELSGLTGIISVSTNNTNELKTINVFDNIPILTAPNAVDISLFYQRNKIESRIKYGLSQDDFIVGFVGGFIDRKGDKRLLKAIEQTDNRIKVAFAGKGDNPPSGEKVVFCKQLSHESIPEFLSALDVFCLPTLSEGSCNALVEAGACGLPIISSDLPFNDDLLNNENSLRINPNSVDEIRDAINLLYTDTNLRLRLASKILDDAKEFDIDKRTDKILHFITSFISL